MPVCAHVCICVNTCLCAGLWVSVWGYTHLWTCRNTYLCVCSCWYMLSVYLGTHEFMCINMFVCMLALHWCIFTCVIVYISTCRYVCEFIFEHLHECGSSFFARSIFPIPLSHQLNMFPISVPPLFSHQTSFYSLVYLKSGFFSSSSLLTLYLLSSSASLPQASSACFGQSHWWLIWRLGLGCIWPFPFWLVCSPSGQLLC